MDQNNEFKNICNKSCLVDRPNEDSHKQILRLKEHIELMQLYCHIQCNQLKEMRTEIFDLKYNNTKIKNRYNHVLAGLIGIALGIIAIIIFAITIRINTGIN